MDPLTSLISGGSGGLSISDPLENRVSNRVGPIDNRVTFGTSQEFSTLQLALVGGFGLLAVVLLRGKS